MVRALRLHRRCQGFESLSDHPFMKRLLLPLIIVGLLGFIFFFIFSIVSGPRLFKDYERRSVKLGKAHYKLYVADSEPKRMRGLSEVEKMPTDQGMVFIFEEPDTYGFWMKDMNFPLDMIFLRDQQVVDVKENILPSTFPQIFYPIAAADAVIELHIGQIQKSGIHIGDSIKVSK